MKIGIGIDTGGTCTDAVIYHFEERKILAWSKTATTKEDLSKGISKALRQLPEALLKKAEVIALSTTLATNACVEKKGGRAKVIFFGANRNTVLRTGAEYGLPGEDALIFIDSKTKPDGQIIRQPDWDAFRRIVREQLEGCDAVGLVEMFARKTGAVLEKKAEEIIRETFSGSVVSGHTIFEENNIVKRGACVLLNAQLISIIKDFTAAVKKVLKELGLEIPVVVVRSDGTLMNETFAEEFPVETLLCGPAASLGGAVELTEEINCMAVDMGGTTTDISLMKNGIPKQAENGVQIGGWNTFVKGLYVDTFGLGGDSGVLLNDFGEIDLMEEKVMPLCMAGEAYPELKKLLEKQKKSGSFMVSQRDEIYVGLKEITSGVIYTGDERRIAEHLFQNPMTIGDLNDQLEIPVVKNTLERLIREGIVIRCGVTPTDAMHLKGDFTEYDISCARLGIQRMAAISRKKEMDICEEIYEAVCWKLYYNLTRVLLEDQDPGLKLCGLSEDTKRIIRTVYEKKKNEKEKDFLEIRISSPITFIGIGAPTHVFLPKVAALFDSNVITPKYARVANALGAVVGHISAKVVIEITLNQQDGTYTVFGRGERRIVNDLNEAKALAGQLAGEKAFEEARCRGAAADMHIELKETESIVKTDFGPLYMGCKITAAATGSLELEEGVKQND